MHSSFGLNVLLLVTANVAYGLQFHAVERGTDRDHVRVTRGISLAIRAMKGFAAVEKLVSGAKSLSSKSIRHRRYQRQGDFETAKEEFYSLNPVNVKEYSGQKQFYRTFGETITGNVGDRRLILKKYGEKGYPMLEVIETKLAPGQYVDRFIYKKTN